MLLPVYFIFLPSVELIIMITIVSPRRREAKNLTLKNENAGAILRKNWDSQSEKTFWALKIINKQNKYVSLLPLTHIFTLVFVLTQISSPLLLPSLAENSHSNTPCLKQYKMYQICHVGVWGHKYGCNRKGKSRTQNWKGIEPLNRSLCTHFYHIFPISIHSLQCIHGLLQFYFLDGQKEVIH